MNPADQSVLHFTCDHCGRRIRSSLSKMGKRLPCPACGMPVIVPGAPLPAPSPPPTNLWDEIERSAQPMPRRRSKIKIASAAIAVITFSIYTAARIDAVRDRGDPGGNRQWTADNDPGDALTLPVKNGRTFDEQTGFSIVLPRLWRATHPNARGRDADLLMFFHVGIGDDHGHVHHSPGPPTIAAARVAELLANGLRSRHGATIVRSEVQPHADGQLVVVGATYRERGVAVHEWRATLICATAGMFNTTLKTDTPTLNLFRDEIEQAIASIQVRSP